MIAWNTASLGHNALYYLRQLNAQRKYFDHVTVGLKKRFMPWPTRTKGYQSKIAKMYNSHEGETGFLICNGPSLAKIDPRIFKNCLTIGCNGIYKNFESWGFHTDYLLFEDVEQFEIRAPDLKNVVGPVKMAAIYNAYALSSSKDWIFFNSPRGSSNPYYWSELYPQFSKDFAAVAHLGSTITYIMLQFAYFIGLQRVIILGLDHNYGKLPELFPPGKIEITENNMELVRTCHFDPNYYKIGDLIGVPNVQAQEQAYKLALDVFNDSGREIINATPDSKLSIFPKKGLDQLLRGNERKHGEI